MHLFSWLLSCRYLVEIELDGFKQEVIIVAWFDKRQ